MKRLVSGFAHWRKPLIGASHPKAISPTKRWPLLAISVVRADMRYSTNAFGWHVWFYTPGKARMWFLYVVNRNWPQTADRATRPTHRGESKV